MQPPHRTIGDTILSDDAFFADLRAAAKKFFEEVRSDIGRQDAMNARLSNVDKGGAIYKVIIGVASCNEIFCGAGLRLPPTRRSALPSCRLPLQCV
jgi:hypothetical protein